jgi:predicted transcriptional regulator of viral defense system
MADGSYISVNLTSKQLHFTKLLDDYEVDIFSIEEIQKKLKTKFENLNEIIENLVRKEILMRIERGKYCKANFKDEMAVANILVPDAAIAYWSALNTHNLTEQISNTVFVQTTKSKKGKKVFGVEYRFIKVAKRKHTGIIKQGFGNRQYRITNVEKTIVDCFDIPEYAGGYDNLIKAFYHAPLKANKLIEYSNAIHNIAAIKRMAVIADSTGKKGLSAFLQFAKKKVNLKYNLFDPFGQVGGEFNNKWKVRMNLSEEKIRQMCQNEY